MSSTVIRRVAAGAKRFWLSLGLALVVLLVVELFSSLVLAIVDERGPIDARQASEAYRDVSWASDYFRELRAADQVMWHSYVYWRRRPFAGQFINVDGNGLRQTYYPSSTIGGTPLKVFVFGGSTVWGTGARDDFTIPSALARHLEGMAIVGDVTNFGESGYVSTQEVFALERELQRGARPDVVVFYDGVNDTFSALQAQVAALPQNETNRVAEFNLLQESRRGELIAEGLARAIRGSATVRLASRAILRLTAADRASPATVPIDDRLADAVLAAYGANVAIVEALGERYGFAPLFYWQPVIFGKDRLTPYERGQAEAVSYAASSYDRVYSRVEKYAASADLRSFHDLSAILRGDERPLFIDFAHLSELGNDIIGARIAADVRAVSSGKIP
jgi:lysophospholipase L1-like esterase